ncbi:hypothetical protein RhiirA4_486249 [Rhizophagus irregularis]|uniref:Uncharacterized protein n=1 Tax=Rhizophagus irregularis TaxID=588596 RepID=A0A2I1HR72_9GLOM|nr:hypothetical protein RhiirA4_486249 [Rhizophagus irregularis]
MERVTEELLNNKDFVNFLHNNFLYTNGPSFFKILDQAIKKHVTAPQYHKHLTQKYLWETLTSLLERYELTLPLSSSTPSLTPIVYSYPPATTTNHAKHRRKLPFWDNLRNGLPLTEF